MPSKNPVLEALRLYGTAAIPGGQSNPLVLEFFKAAGHAWVQDDDTPWCSAFLNALMRACGLPYTGSLAARSWLNVGIAITEPELGDVVVFWRISKTGPYGHCGVFVSKTRDQIFVLGGNQNNRVDISAFPTERLLGYRRLTISV